MYITMRRQKLSEKKNEFWTGVEILNSLLINDNIKLIIKIINYNINIDNEFP